MDENGHGGRRGCLSQMDVHQVLRPAQYLEIRILLEIYRHAMNEAPRNARRTFVLPLSYILKDRSLVTGKNVVSPDPPNDLLWTFRIDIQKKLNYFPTCKPN